MGALCDSDMALVVHELALVGTSPQNSNALSFAMAMYTAPMLSSPTPTVSPLPTAPMTLDERCLDSNISSRFSESSSISLGDQMEGSQPDHPVVRTPSKRLSLGSFNLKSHVVPCMA